MTVIAPARLNGGTEPPLTARAAMEARQDGKLVMFDEATFRPPS